MSHFWPTPIHVVEYSPEGLTVFMLSALLGLAWAFVLERRPAHGRVFLLVAGLFVAAAMLHLAGIVTLMRDPHRDLGFIPLPPPLADGAAWLCTAFMPFSPGLATFTIARVFLADPPVHRAVRIIVAVVAIYAASVGPWAGAVLLD